MKAKITAASMAISQFILAASVRAQSNPNPLPQPHSSDLGPILQNVINWILGIAGLLAVLMLVIGGVRYVISAGNPTQTEGAKKTIIYALVGIVVIILAYVLVNTVIGLFG